MITQRDLDILWTETELEFEDIEEEFMKEFLGDRANATQVQEDTETLRSTAGRGRGAAAVEGVPTDSGLRSIDTYNV